MLYSSKLIGPNNLVVNLASAFPIRPRSPGPGVGVGRGVYRGDGFGGLLGLRGRVRAGFGGVRRTGARRGTGDRRGMAATEATTVPRAPPSSGTKIGSSGRTGGVGPERGAGAVTTTSSSGSPEGSGGDPSPPPPSPALRPPPPGDSPGDPMPPPVMSGSLGRLPGMVTSSVNHVLAAGREGAIALPARRAIAHFRNLRIFAM